MNWKERYERIGRKVSKMVATISWDDGTTGTLKLDNLEINDYINKDGTITISGVITK